MTPSRDRAQLVLVGAIAIAFVLLGMVAVFNGLVYTDSASSSETGQKSGTALATERGLVDGVQRIAEEAWNEDEFEFEGGLERELTEYVEQYRRTTAASGTAVVSAETAVDEDEREARRFRGDRISPDGERRFDGEIPYFVIETGHDRESQQIVITAIPLEGEPTEITLDPTGDGEVEFRSTDDCTIAGSTVAFDLVTGEVDDGAEEAVPNDCEYGVIDRDTRYEAVTVEPTTDAVLGSYDVVTTAADVQDDDWTGVEVVDLTLRYDSGDVTTERDHTIFGFGDEP